MKHCIIYGYCFDVQLDLGFLNIDRLLSYVLLFEVAVYSFRTLVIVTCEAVYTCLDLQLQFMRVTVVK